MPLLLLRERSNANLSLLVEKSRKQPLSRPPAEYDLRLNDGHLHLILVNSKPERKIPTTPDEGFESDIDSLSIVSSDNDSFTTEKISGNGSKTTETDSANGSSSSSDSDTDVTDSKQIESPADQSESSESYNLVDCVCYTDVKSNDILIFVIKNEAFVFKFDDLKNLQAFHANFSALKAVANQKAYGKNFGTKFNLLQRTDRNGVTHIEITRETKTGNEENASTGIAKLDSREELIKKFNKNFQDRKNEDYFSKRQRNDAKFMNDIKFNTINSKLGPRAKIITRSSSIENILDLEEHRSSLVSAQFDATLRKVWNSAEDLLDPPKRPERRKKVKGRAPQPPVDRKVDVFSGQYVRVNVNFDPIKDFDTSRLIIKSSLNEPHPKKLQNFNILGSKPSLSFLKPKEKQVLKYEPKKLETGAAAKGGSRPVPESYWTNSVPRLLKKPKSKSESRNFVPMAYRYIDTTRDYPVSYAVNPSTRTFPQNVGFGQNLSLSNYLRGESSSQNISNRLFGLSPKLKDFSSGSEEAAPSTGGKWSGSGDANVYSSKDYSNNLKSVIKNSRDDSSKKKNDKKVTFSAYTTVQVV